jgi:hypothetical protein
VHRLAIGDAANTDVNSSELFERSAGFVQHSLGIMGSAAVAEPIAV